MTESETNTQDAATSAATNQDNPENAPPKIDWADPNVPAGNAPAMPAWPLFGSAVVFTLWLAFLVAMAFIRVRTVSF